MKYTYLKHDRRLRYAKANALRLLPEDVQVRYGCDRLVSFRKLPGRRKPDDLVKKLHAAMRPMGIYSGNAICFYAVETDSPLAALLLWDAVHFMEVGQKITLVEDVSRGFYLDRDYFCQGLKVLHRTTTEVTYEKVAKFAAEGDDDLDNWTFGIPVGPEDATILNAVVKRILELDIPNKEILLCGRPGDNFAYFDKVRIVGEDITAPPVQICKKKNRLVQEATYNNLAILHDRIFLPSHFGKMVRRFGPRYPLMSMQSMIFDDRVCMHPRRYSDYGMATGELAHGLKGLHRCSGAAVSVAPSVFVELERTGFFFTSPMRYHLDCNYPTGSFYICRKEVWNSFALDESLTWIEFEDIEHAFRASKGGVPCRLNPHGINQTITSRPLLGLPTHVEGVSGRLTPMIPVSFTVFPRKPLFKVSMETALKKLSQFAGKYHSASMDGFFVTGKKEVGSLAWLGLVNLVIQQASFPNTYSDVRDFIDDYEKYLLLDQLTLGQKELIRNRFMDDPQEAKKNMIMTSFEVRNMICQRPLGGWFYKRLDEYFHGRKRSLFGIIFTAIILYCRNGRIFYFESIFAAVRDIYNSTPFKSYIKGRK